MEITKADIARALAGDRAVIRLVVDQLTPVVHERVARILLRRRAQSAGRDLRQDVADMVQDVFVLLFEHDGKVLRSWDPERGMSLRNFAGLAAERHVLSRLRSRTRNPWTEEPLAEIEPGEGDSEVPLPDDGLAFRELVERLADRVREELTPLGNALFSLLYIDRKPVEEVCASVQMKPDAVYAWRSRIGKRLRILAAEILSEIPPAGRMPK